MRAHAHKQRASQRRDTNAIRAARIRVIVLHGASLPFGAMGRYSSKRDTGIDTGIDTSRIGLVSFDWLFMSPVIKGYITYDKLHDGSLTLFDIYAMNEAIEYIHDVQRFQYEIR